MTLCECTLAAGVGGCGAADPDAEDDSTTGAGSCGFDLVFLSFLVGGDCIPFPIPFPFAFAFAFAFAWAFGGTTILGAVPVADAACWECVEAADEVEVVLENEELDMGGNPESPRAGGKTDGAKSACMLILERLFCRPSDLDEAGDFCGFGVGCADDGVFVWLL